MQKEISELLKPDVAKLGESFGKEVEDDVETVWRYVVSRSARRIYFAMILNEV